MSKIRIAVITQHLANLMNTEITVYWK